MNRVPDSPIDCVDNEFVGKMLCEHLAIPKGKYLEVGVFRGMTLSYMIENSGMKVTGVDRWKTDKDYMHDSANIEELEYFYFWLMKKYGDKARLIRSTSDEASKYFKKTKEKFDLIFIDADHRYENVKRDIKNYWPLVKKKKAVFAGHDYVHGRDTPVNKAVHEFASSKNLEVRCIPHARVWFIRL